MSTKYLPSIFGPNPSIRTLFPAKMIKLPPMVKLIFRLPWLASFKAATSCAAASATLLAYWFRLLVRFPPPTLAVMSMSLSWSV